MDEVSDNCGTNNVAMIPAESQGKPSDQENVPNNMDEVDIQINPEEEQEFQEEAVSVKKGKSTPKKTRKRSKSKKDKCCENLEQANIEQANLNESDHDKTGIEHVGMLPHPTVEWQRPLPLINDNEFIAELQEAEREKQAAAEMVKHAER